MTTLLRIVALAIAVGGAVDPQVSARRSHPVAVEFRVGPGSDAAGIHQRLVAELGADVTLAQPGRGDAVVVIDREVDAESIRDGVTVSVVTAAAGPNLRLVAARARSRFLAGQEGAIDVDVEARGLTGRKAHLTVTHNGVEVGRAEHTWTAATRQRVAVPFATIAAGAYPVRVSVAPYADETREDDNAVDARIVGVEGPLRIAFVEPRPSWAAGFVRRVLESDPSFDVASVLRPSRGIAVRTGSAPASLTPAALTRYDAIVLGAPEELLPAEIDALRAFMSERGGTVVALSDRRPSGAFAGFVAPAGFDEVLLDAPVSVLPLRGGRGPRASEFAIPRTPGAAMRPLASLPGGRTVIASWPVGDGTLIFSGALDMWRYRGDDGDRFASFWRASLAAAALAAPPAVHADLVPSIVQPGTESRVVARIRGTEVEREPDGSLRFPVIRGVAVGVRGRTTSTEAVRLWPTAEPGVFRGRFTPAQNGAYQVHVTAGGAQHAAVVIETDRPEAAADADEEMRLVAAATGGAVASADSLDPVLTHLRSLARSEIGAVLHPMRSAWWTLPFAVALCAEWTLRRRRGAR